MNRALSVSYERRQHPSSTRLSCSALRDRSLTDDSQSTPRACNHRGDLYRSDFPNHLCGAEQFVASSHIKAEREH